jgi:hypothetical protein
MEYTTTVLNRFTGATEAISLGDWITITELGEMYAVGPKRVRQVLYHMGLLQRETTNGKTEYRLTKDAIGKGLGRRNLIKTGRMAGKTFDVISPKGRDLIRQAWEDTITDLDLDSVITHEVQEANKRLNEYDWSRHTHLDKQGRFLWAKYHYPDLTNDQYAFIAGVEVKTIEKYQKIRRDQLAERAAARHSNLGEPAQLDCLLIAA